MHSVNVCKDGRSCYGSWKLPRPRTLDSNRLLGEFVTLFGRDEDLTDEQLESFVGSAPIGAAPTRKHLDGMRRSITVRGRLDAP